MVVTAVATTLPIAQPAGVRSISPTMAAVATVLIATSAAYFTSAGPWAASEPKVKYRWRVYVKAKLMMKATPAASHVGQPSTWWKSASRPRSTRNANPPARRYRTALWRLHRPIVRAPDELGGTGVTRGSAL